MSAEHHDTGKAFIENQAPGVSPAFEPVVQSGRALELGATNDLAIPIHNNGGTGSFLTYHDIANDEIIQIGNAVDGGSSKELVINGDFSQGFADWSADTDGWTTDNVVASSVGLSDKKLRQFLISEVGKPYIVSIDVTNYISGTLYVSLNASIAGGTNRITITSNGTHTAVLTSEATTLALYASGGLTCDVDNVSVKEILPTSTEYILNDVTVNNILTHKMAFSAGDLTLIQQEPNLLAALAMGEATPISSVTLDVDDSWYACSEVSGADVFDARA